MRAVFKVTKDLRNKVIVTGLERPDKLYVKEDLFANLPGIYRYSDTITINFLIKYNSDKEEQYAVMDYFYHVTNDIGDYGIDQNIFLAKEDGLYKVVHIIVPTIMWLDQFLHDIEDPITKFYGLIYVMDPETKTLYKYLNNSLIEANIEELLSVNTSSAKIENHQPTTVSREEEYIFLLDNLEYCYYLLCRRLINDELCGKRCYNGYEVDNSYNYRIWKIIYVLRHILLYLLLQGRYFKAQSLLEDMFGCDTICESLIKGDEESSNSSGCGCSK